MAIPSFFKKKLEIGPKLGFPYSPWHLLLRKKQNLCNKKIVYFTAICGILNGLNASFCICNI